MRCLFVLLFFVISLNSSQSQEINYVEYFIDNDPGYGLANSVMVIPGNSVDLTINADLNGLDPGIHKLYIRARDNENKWSFLKNHTFFINPIIPGSEIAEVEYFFDNDPGAGNGCSNPLSTPSLDTTIVLNVQIPDTLTIGNHFLFVRAKNQNGYWGPITGDTLMVDNSILPDPPVFVFSPSSINAAAGEIITVDVSVSDFSDITSYQFSVNWNPDHLSFVSVSDLNPDLNLDLGNFLTTMTNSGKLASLWSDPMATPYSIPNGSVLFSLTFEIIVNTSVLTPIQFSNVPTAIEVTQNTGSGIMDITANTTFNGSVVEIEYLPVAHDLTVSNVIENNPVFTDPKVLWSGSTNLTNISPIKVCADSSKATHIIFQKNDPNLDINDIRFRVLADSNQMDPEKYGHFDEGDISVMGNELTVKYSHPTYLAENGIYRVDTIQIYNQSNGNEIFKLPVEIYRAPVVMIHGLWGDLRSFEEMENHLKNNTHPQALIYRADYYFTNASSFSTNVYEVKKAVNHSIRHARNSLFSTSKIDVVAHSMGGVLTRVYLQELYGVKYNDDIHKLITLNSPHSGTQSANFLLSNAMGAEEARGLIEISFLLPGGGNQMWTGLGAVYDLQVDHISNGTHLLNNSLDDQHIVPTHTIYTEVDCNILNLGCSFGVGSEGLLFNLVRLFRTENSVNELLNNLYNNSASDLIVPTVSQIGGIQKNSYHSDQKHVGSPSNSNIISSVETLLKINPNDSNVFSTNGFNPDTLSFNLMFKNPSDEDNYLKNIVSNGSISIIDPINGSYHNTGSSITVSVSGSPEIETIVYFAGNQEHELAYEISESSSADFIYQIPPEISGEAFIYAYGFNSTEGFVDKDSIIINININSNLDSISVYPESIFTPEFNHFSIYTDGFFSDGIERDMSHSDSIYYIIADTSIVKHYNKNIFYTLDTGFTEILVQFQGNTKIIPVEVYEGFPPVTISSFGVAENETCLNSSVEFINNSLNSQEFIWLFGDGVTSNDFEPYHIYTQPGFYDISLIAIDTLNNISDTLILNEFITVHPLPEIEVLELIDLVCEGDSSGAITIAVNSINFPLVYSWSHEQSLDDSIANNLIPGVYQITVIDSKGCADIDSFEVMEVAPIIPTISNDGDSLISSFAISYQWYLDSMPIQGAINQSYFPTESGDYSVSVIDINGCEATSEIFIITGWSEIESLESFKIYPNPTNNNLTTKVVFTKITIAELNLYDIFGQIINQTIFESSEIQHNVNLKALPNGTYILELVTKEGRVVKKILKI